MAQDISQITVQQFIDMVLERAGAQIVTITTATEPKLKRTNPFGVITKTSVVNGVINFNYQNAVNRQRGREGNDEQFTSAPRQWGQRIEGTPFVEHNGQHYLTIKVEKTSAPPSYVDAMGQTVNHEDLMPHFYASSRGSGRQMVADEVITRDYKLANVTAIKMRGKTYMIIQRGEVQVFPRPTA